MALAKITIVWLKPNIKLILKDGLKPIPIQILQKNREIYILSFELPPDLSKTMFFIIPQFELPPDLSENIIILFAELNCLQIYLEEKN